MKSFIILIASITLVLCLQFNRGFSLSSLVRKPNSLLHSRTKLSAATALPVGSVAPAITAEAENDEKVGVLLLNLGGPETGDDVEG